MLHPNYYLAMIDPDLTIWTVFQDKSERFTTSKLSLFPDFVFVLLTVAMIATIIISLILLATLKMNKKVRKQVREWL